MNIKRILGAAAFALALAPFAALAATSTYSMKVVPTMPKGSAGEKPASTQPSSTKFTPCDSTGVLDAVTITLTYNAGTAGSTTAPLLPVYLFFYNPSAAGTNADPRVFVITKTNLQSGGPALDPRADIMDVNPATDAYLPTSMNIGGTITETLFGANIVLDGAADGTWQVVGIIANSSTVNFDAPSTWSAWDVATMILGKPWTGSPYTLCQ